MGKTWLRGGGRQVLPLLMGLAWSAAGGGAMAVEEAAYTVEKTDGRFEVRRYAPQVVAEVMTDGTLEQAGNKAFRPLFNYISGANRTQEKIAMTSPVGQTAESRKIAMTSPVGQIAVSNRWAVSFMMPAHETLDTLPTPTDTSVMLRAIPARRLAAVRYSGTWSQRRYEHQLARLRAWMADLGLTPEGEPVWARYNPPFTPWFMRRNEILVPVGEPLDPGQKYENGESVKRERRRERLTSREYLNLQRAVRPRSG